MILKIYNKYKSIIMYLFFGICTTLVNVITYYIFSHILKIGIMSSTIISWIFAVLFAYITNRKWVFNSSVKKTIDIFRELVSFFACRLATGFVDLLCMYIFVSKLGFSDMIIKIVSNIVVIILNYVSSKLIVFNDRKDNSSKYNKIDILIYISFLVVSFLFLLKSPLHIWNCSESGTDSSVFRTIALMMRNGYMPYLHVFDHKGPLIYLYNYIGTFISMSRGVWIIEFASLYVTMCCFFKIAKLKCNNLISYFITILSVSLLFNYFEGGNLTEEYALPFISISIYLFLDYIINGIINKKRLMICGLCFGSVLMLRPNMICTWAVFCIFIFIDCLKNKKFSSLTKFIIYFSIGISIVIIPIMLWLWLSGAIREFYNDYILFNSKYSAMITTPESTKFINIWETIFYFLNNALLIISYIIVIYFIKLKKINPIYLIYMIISLIFICLSGRQYNHYMMIFVPIIIYPFSVLYEYLNHHRKSECCRIIVFLVSSYFIVSTISPSWIDTIKKLPYTYYNRNKNRFSSDIVEISNIIDSKTIEKDKISVYGNWDIIYVVSNRVPATKYSFQFPIGDVSPKILEAYYKELKKEIPKIIVIQSGRYDDRISDFLFNNNYKLIYGVAEKTSSNSLVFELEKK